jgi:ribonuclease R
MGGILVRYRGKYHVRPANPRIDREIVIVGGPGEAREGDTVTVDIRDWGRGGRYVYGAIGRVFGEASEHDPGIVSIMLAHGLPFDFPSEVIEEAETIAERNPLDRLSGRSDGRALHAFTIDPEDAHDYDDALSLENLGGDRWRVGMHIADVSHYVRPGSAIDREALRRGTSVYLVDRAVPMLPGLLTGDICSLMPGEDRPAVSVFVLLDGEGRLRETELRETIIHSQARLTYDEAQGILEGRMESKFESLAEDLRKLHELSRCLHRRRVGRGSLDFDRPEPLVILDDEGHPVDVRRVDPLDSHGLIEEFMVLANEVVAELLTEKQIPLIYRVHEAPSEDELEDLERCLQGLGWTPAWRTSGISPGSFQRILDDARGRKEEHIVNYLVLRSMKRALYSAQNKGHFGLAASRYTHFTSPIRRYPDLVVHRQLKALLHDEQPPLTSEETEHLVEISAQASERERAADLAEWESVDLKVVDFMAERTGERYSGTISGFASAGFFVLLDSYYIEGMVPLRDLEDDFYEFIDESYHLRGRRTGRIFSLGDRVTVQVAGVSRMRREIDFRLLGHEAV